MRTQWHHLINKPVYRWETTCSWNKFLIRTDPPESVDPMCQNIPRSPRIIIMKVTGVPGWIQYENVEERLENRRIPVDQGSNRSERSVDPNNRHVNNNNESIVTREIDYRSHLALIKRCLIINSANFRSIRLSIHKHFASISRQTMRRRRREKRLVQRTITVIPRSSFSPKNQ